jgi:hypothetical protein
MLKRCAGPCKQLKHVPEDFSVRNKEKGTYQPYCKECKRTYYGPRWRSRHKHEDPARIKRRLAPRHELMLQLKHQPCVDCGRKLHHALMDFDHRESRNGDEKLLINRMAYYGYQRFLREISKCDVVCVLCHRMRTWNRAHPDDLIG